MNGNFCDDKFWDLNKTWYSEIPDFSQCFQDTALVSAPSLMFSFIFFINIILLPKTSSQRYLPWTWLNISKLVLSLSLLILSIMWCGIVICQKVTTFNVPHSVLLSSCSRVILFITTTVILLRHRTSGVTTSYLLSIFWLCFSLISLNSP